ncbi:hypothetical protein [Pseudoalteromonas sp. NJ631]|uniref:hypothetical protein n=1 Tax=Pseudoalteromonas sp. NJ631 TaxID=493915 RepID=UPI00031D65E6|nr:hypothetical protein [Pseudoalteromonas sp. NJ631]
MKLKEKMVGEVEQKLLEMIRMDVAEHYPTVSAFYLEGGHFDPRYSATEFSIDSMVKVLNVANNAILEHKKKLKVVLGVLIDDLGLQCGSESCDISASPAMTTDSQGLAPLPDELEAVLSDYSIVKRDRLVLQGERNCKNRGIQSLRKIISQDLASFPQLSLATSNDVTKILFENSKGVDIVLAESKDKDIWTAKCPLIMAQHYKDTYQKALKMNPQAGVFHIMDFSEMDDFHKVVNGTEVALGLFLQDESLGDNIVKISNIFLSDFDMEDYSINTQTSTLAETCEA